MRILRFCAVLMVVTLSAASALAVPLPGGTLDPMTIPKYVQPLVIPPVMPMSTVQPAALNPDGTPILDPLTQLPVAVPAAEYNIAVRQFSQQILPGGIWNTVNGRTDAFLPTPIWSYGLEQDNATTVSTYVAPMPLAGLGTTATTYNYPALTIEATSQVGNSVRWINDLKDPLTGAALPHLLTGTVDQTLHWANPANTGCVNAPAFLQIDCNTYNPLPYGGPVPIVTHVHGAHVNANSDGYPEAWWLANASDIPASYSKTGTLFTQQMLGGTVALGTAQDPQYRNGDGTPMLPIQADFDPVGGAAYYSYENTQPATTLWYHDHALGMTRLNVYAGPAGFWLLRGGLHDLPSLPGPAPLLGQDPNFDPAARAAIREVPIAIQDRSFNADGTLFYPQSRVFFDGFAGPYIGAPDAAGVQTSDINPIWNPEAFFNTMVVNGTTWPVYEVAPAQYRLRLLNGSNSRFINLSMFEVVNDKTSKDQAKNKKPKKKVKADVLGAEIPFYQIGGDQGFLPQVVMIQTGMATALPGNGTLPAPALLPDPMQALLMAPAERMDVIVDFSGLPDGTVIRILNTAPDAPFGGFPDIPADAGTTGQVMQFVVNSAAVPVLPSDTARTPLLSLVLPAEAPSTTVVDVTRPLSLNEEESFQVCVAVSPAGALTYLGSTAPHNANIAADCAAMGGVPQAPKAAVLGTIAADPNQGGVVTPVPLLWKQPITELPVLGATEIWEFYNMTVDGHPIHMHLVAYEIIDRQLIDPVTVALIPGSNTPPLANELGRKDTVLSYPGEVVRVKSTFDLPGLYVWHCHIVEHEDNEMMRPLYVGNGTIPTGFPRP
jgi:spore coat protein A